MKRYWELARTTIDALSFRERAIIFAATTFVLVALLNAILLDPLLSKKKSLSDQMQQPQGRMKEQQAALESLLQAKRDVAQSPLRLRATQLQQQLDEQDAFLKTRSDRLIDPARMSDLLRNVLSKNNQLQLVALKTLPASPLMDTAAEAAGNKSDQQPGNQEQSNQKKIFKHGVQITVRGGYLDLMRYLTALESMPGQMFWGEINFAVEKYPNGLLTITLYTLSLDKTWLTV